MTLVCIKASIITVTSFFFFLHVFSEGTSTLVELSECQQHSRCPSLFRNNLIFGNVTSPVGEEFCEWFVQKLVSQVMIKQDQVQVL